MASVLILGAGISGLTVAFRLQQLLPKVDITVLESRNRPGGSIWTERRDGFQFEIGPNGFLDSKPTTVELCRDLSLGDHLVPASAVASKNRYLFLDGKLKPLPNGLLSFLKTDLLSWRGKFGLLMERFRPARLDPADESVAAFATRRAGKEVAEVFADALVTGIHAGDPQLLSIRAAFPRVATLEREFGSVFKGFARQAKQRRHEAKLRGESTPQRSRMWTLREGLGLLVETLSSQLNKKPLYGFQVRRIARSDRHGKLGWTVATSSQERLEADAIVLACPAYEQATLLADLDPALADKIAGIAYNRVAVVALGFRRHDVPSSLEGFGYIAPQRSRRDLLGVQWCSSIFPGRAPEGCVLLRAMCGGWHRADVVGWDDDRLVAAVRRDLELALGIRAAPIVQHIVRWDRAIPQYQLGHLERVAWIEERVMALPGIFLAGNAYHGVAINDCTEQGAVLAKKVAAYLSAKP